MCNWKFYVLLLRMVMGRMVVSPRPDPFRYPPKKTRLLPRPACFNGYPFNPPWRVPDSTQFFLKDFFNAGSSDPVNVVLNQPLDRIWPNHHHRSSCSAESKQDLSHCRSVRTYPVRGSCCRSVLQTRSNPRFHCCLTHVILTSQNQIRAVKDATPLMVKTHESKDPVIQVRWSDDEADVAEPSDES